MDEFEVFLEKEKEYQMLEKEIDLFYYWRYLRFSYWNAYNHRMQNNKKKRKSKNYIKQLFFLLVNSMHNIRIKKNISDILLITHPRKVRNTEGKYECLYTDFLSKELSNVQTIEFPFMKSKHFKPESIENIFYMDFIYLKSHIYTLLYRIFNKKKLQKLKTCVGNEIELFTNALHNECTKNKKVNSYDKNKLINSLTKDAIAYYISYQYRKKEYKKLLKKIKPKIIIETVSYVIDKMIINELAYELNIITIELQHGMMGKKNIAYNYLTQNSIVQFPQYIFTFSEYWTKENRLPIKNNKIIPVGYPYLERQTILYKSKEKTEITTILFLSQPILGKELSKIAIELLKKLDHKYYHIIYKLHPLEFEIWKEQYPELHNDRIEIVGKDGKNLYQCFAESDCQVGVYSTALYEGLAYSLDTYLLQIKGVEYVEDLINNDVATLFSDTSELIKSMRKKEKNSSNYRVEEFFWKKDANNNMIVQINKILQSKIGSDRTLI